MTKEQIEAAKKEGKLPFRRTKVGVTIGSDEEQAKSKFKGWEITQITWEEFESELSKRS